MQKKTISEPSVASSADISKNSSSINRYLNLVGLLLFVIFIFWVGFFSGKIWGGFVDSRDISNLYEITGKKENEEVTELDFDHFWEVWGTLETRYVEQDLPEDDMYYGAIKGMVAGIDDHATIYLTPEETEAYKKGNVGEFEGIGAELGYEDGGIVVVAPLEGSPAKEAGLKAKDKILEVDGKEINAENIFEVVAQIRGEKGTKVTLTVYRSSTSETLDIEIERGEIRVPSVTYEESVGDDKDIAVIDVDRFTEASAEAWTKRWDNIVAEVKEDDPDAVILDLRGNPGGYFSSAVWAAGEFLDDGDLVALQQDRNGKEYEFTVSRKGRLQDVPLVVLVDEGSASASEILAGALQYHERAYVIGEKTYGKGTAQEIEEYDDGSSLHITTLKWLMPNGVWLNPEDVIEPDKIVEYDEDDFKNGDDPQMQEAVEKLD